MTKTCWTCIHKDVCEYLVHPLNKEVNCTNWQEFRYTGKWIKTKNGFRCSECGEEAAVQFSYCPDCGSSMMYEVL